MSGIAFVLWLFSRFHASGQEIDMIGCKFQHYCETKLFSIPCANNAQEVITPFEYRNFIEGKLHV